MRILDTLNHIPYPTADRHRPGWIALTLVAAGVLFLLALAIGYRGFTITARLLGAATGGAIGIAILLAVMQTRWFWRLVRWHEQRPRRKPQTLKEKILAEATTVLLIILAVVMLVYSLLNSPYQ